MMIKRLLYFAFPVALGAALLVLCGVIFVPSFSDWIVGLLRGDEKREVINLIGWGIAGILAFFGAVAVNRRADAQVKISESQLESAAAQSRVADAQVKNNELVEKGHVQERFKTAVGHLGSKEVAARIASFYEFSYLARDNEDLRRNIFDILCAHLRQTTADKKYKEEIGFTDEGINIKVRPTEEVQSLLDVLFQSKDGQEGPVFAEFKPNLRRISLMGAALQKADLRGADLRGADLQGAVLFGANLQSSKLSGANLRKVDLWDSHLQEADLWGSCLQEARLIGARMQKAFLWHADLQGADLIGAHMQDVDLRDANLRDANLVGADLQGANLSGADFYNAKNLETANLSKAKIKGAKFPEGYEPPADADTTSDADTTGDD